MRSLRPRILGRRITGVSLTHDDLLDGVSRGTLLRQLRGRKLESIARRAKHALIQTDTRILAVQPGMTGALLHAVEEPTGREAMHLVLRCRLDDGTWLVYRDARRLGTIRWLDAEGWGRYAARLGPEPLDPTLTPAWFAERMGGSRLAIKKALMDQRIIVGVGNIYASEALFAAGIDPSRVAGTVSRDALEVLFEEVRRILASAIEREGTSFRDYVTGTGTSGHFQEVLQVYGREGLPCRRCGTRLVATHDIDARGTVFCWRCQR